MSGPPALTVPPEDGGVLVWPPPSEVAGLLERSRTRLRSLDRKQARAELTGREVSDPVIMGGHQPELFHPGVWLKNFALHDIARTHHALSVNLVIDNDAARTTIDVPVVRLPLPAIDEFRPHAVAIALDHVSPGLPYEEWNVRDEAFFRALPERVKASGEHEPDDFLQRFWDEVCRQPTANVPERLAMARRSLERAWGCENLEVPISGVCRTEPFARFATHILTGLPHFHDVFNLAVRAFRKAHRLKSRHHPFPELVRDGDWLETPFWTWKPGAVNRARLFARPLAGGFALRLGKEEGPELLRSDLVRDWMRLEQNGVKVRSRAVTTTLFARLFLADLFVHGIGGAKYDAVTDAVIERFYGVEPPPYLVVSGTLRLPLPGYAASLDKEHRLARLRRDLVYNPQRYRTGDGSMDELLAARQAILEREPADREGRRERWRTMRRLNEQLAGFLEERRRETEGAFRRCHAEREANAVLRRRDWAFCLYPEQSLREFCMK